MKTLTFHVQRFWPPVFLFTVSIALLCHGAPAPTWEAASGLFAKGRWTEAEKALDAYAGQTPTPPHRAEALVLEARCREKRRDIAGARKVYESVIRDDSLRRASPAAVADAYNRLHSLLVADAKSAPARRRLVDDAKRRISGTSALSRILEREGDALLASGDMRGARAAYAGAGEGLSKAGKDVAALIAVGGESNPLADADVARMMSAAREKPSVATALVAHLATRRDGWKAEDAAAQLLMEGGKPAEAAKAWGELLRRHRGPSDRIGLSRCEALAKADPKRGLVAFTEWLGRNRDSKLREYAEARQALLTASHGDLSEAASLLEAFLARHPNSRDAESVRKSLATVRQSISREKDLAAEKAVRDEARRNDPALARLERAESLLDRRRANEAAKEFETFRNIPMHPLWARAWYGLGRARLEAGDAKGALSAWDEVWRRATESTNIAYAVKSRRATGDLLLEEGDPARALKAYDEVAARSPKAADASFDLNRGLALMALGRHADAAAVFTARRDKSGGDKAEFLRWDGLVALCAAGGPPPVKAPPDRRALTDLVLADGLLEAGDPRRALKFYRRAGARLSGHDGADRCALGSAMCLSAMGRVRDALKAYSLFRDKYARSALAPQALLFAGTLCASPQLNNPGMAREWFDLAVRNHPATREAVAAEFYSATLAWHGRKWAEAARLHQAFADNHPDSPLARVALEQRLPAIAAKKAFPHDCDNVDRTVVVGVRPRDRKRKAIPINKETAYNAHLDIVPLNGWRIRKSEIIIWWDSRGVGRLWYGPDPATPDKHCYHLCDAYSSQEFVMIEGELYKPVEGPGKTTNKQDPPFRVTVPSVDVDWAGFARPHDEDDEEKRFIIVPLNRNGNDDKRWIELNSPYDDDERELRPSFPYGRPVNPDITLNWEAANCLGLLRDGTTGILNGWTINAKQVFDWNWPIRFLVDPRQTAGSFRIFVEGQEDDVREKALDTIHGRVINVDIDVDSDYDGDIDDNDEPLEETQGGFVGVGAENLTPIRLSFGPLLAQLPGKLKLSATNGGNHIRLWKNAQRGEQVFLPAVWQNPSQMPTTLYVEGVTPSAVAKDVELTLEYDEVPEGTPQNKQYLFKCSDKIALTVVNVDLVGYAAWRGEEDKCVPDDEEFEPGFLVTREANRHRSAKLKFKAIPNTSLRRYCKFSQGGLILTNNAPVTTSGELEIPGNADYSVNVDMDELAHWGENTTHVDVEYIVKDAGGNVIGTDKCRLLRPFVVAIGDSLTYGVWQYATNGQHCTMIPTWKQDENEPYPGRTVWEDPARVTPPNNVYDHCFNKAYQGYRGYLAEQLPGFTWLGMDTGGHGPQHNGYPGAKTIDIYRKLKSGNSPLTKSPSYTFVVFLSGMNDCNRSKTNQINTIVDVWTNVANSIVSMRTNKGRTLFMPLQVPMVKPNDIFTTFHFAGLQKNLGILNRKIANYRMPEFNYITLSVVDTANVPHANVDADNNLSDDGMHFDSTGYKTIANRIFQSLEGELR